MTKFLTFTLILVFILLAPFEAEAKRKRRRSSGPQPTHPVILWSRTLSESKNKEERKVAAFKLSQYSQPIFQDEVVKTLLNCAKDPDLSIRVLCTKAMGRAGTQSHQEAIRKTLLESYAGEAQMRNTVVRTFIARKDNNPAVHDKLLEALNASTKEEEMLTLLAYFENYGVPGDAFVNGLNNAYQKAPSTKIKRGVVKALADRSGNSDTVMNLLVECSQSHDTPLALTCLSGLETKGKKDQRSWQALEKTILSDDPDVLLSSLDVVNALPV